mgnify:CR=1 FL=1
MPHLLELFSGTGSMGRAFRAKGWEVTSVDCDRAADATIEADIRDLDVSRLGKIDAIWASPPCTMYSRARSTGRAADLGVVRQFGSKDSGPGSRTWHSRLVR